MTACCAKGEGGGWEGGFEGVGGAGRLEGVSMDGDRVLCEGKDGRLKGWEGRGETSSQDG
eukprot:366489-Chlamydomonas_euryale.AAC.13